MTKLTTFLIRAFSKFSPDSGRAIDPVMIIKDAHISAPQKGIALTEDYTVSAFSLRRLLYFYHDPAKRCPIRSQWDSALTTTQSREMVSFSALEGCLSSKSHVTDFERMLDHPKASAIVRYHIDTYTDRVEDLADQVLRGSIDCAVYKDAPAKIMRQGWDGKMWLSNDGGSHRSAAIWHIDRAQGTERLLPALVETHDIDSKFKDLCAHHTILMFRPHNPSILHDHKAVFQNAGLTLARQEITPIEPHPQDWCLIIPASHPRHDALTAMMADAFDLSAWVRKACAPAPVKPAPGANATIDLLPRMS
jgi:hypothetical protein